MAYTNPSWAMGSAGSAGSAAPAASGGMGSIMGVGAGLGGIGAGLFDLFGSHENPMGDASKYYDQIPDELKKYLQPYIDRGNKEYGDLSGTYNQMTNDPMALWNKFGAGYTKSPGYDFKLKQGESAISNAAAAGGMAGTPMHQQEAGQLAENLSDEDYNNYMNHIMSLFSGGLQGKQGFYDTGVSASGNLAESLAQLLANKGNMAYQAAQDREAQKQAGIGDIFSGIGTAASSIFGL